jgi:maltokinase
MQRYLGDAAEGWLTATASVRDLMAEADLHAAEVGGDFAGEAARLGRVVATVHADLVRALGERALAAEGAAGVVEAMHRRLSTALQAVGELAPYANAVRASYDAARAAATGTRVQEVHGDLHLGQALRSTSGWTLIDFEGEPAATLADRNAPRSPLVDVAGMLRSFDYAAHQWMAGREPEEHQRQQGHQWGFRAAEWARRNIDAFCSGYAEKSGDPRERPELLRAFELDKAVYEVAYEHAHRPDWLAIPLAAVARLTGT